MDFITSSKQSIVSFLGSNTKTGLSAFQVRKNKNRFGENLLTSKKSRSLPKKIADTLKEPMMVILCFGFIITFGVNLGKCLKGGQGNFSECAGILGAIVLSTLITLIMEGSSERAFNALNEMLDSVCVNVIREGKTISVEQKDVVVGDIVVLKSGGKIVADGRVIESNCLFVDESMLTGESLPVEKFSNDCGKSTSILERECYLHSGTFVTSGEGKMIVTCVGDNTEMGKLAKELKEKKDIPSPLEQKLGKLGKTITIIGVVCSVIVFIISFIKLVLINDVCFENVNSLVISSIVLIVAAVPEGLPTIVAVSLALNMIKLAKKNALIKKMIATETCGAISVICSDKTGTLTKNQMVAENYFNGEYLSPKKITDKNVINNFALNCTAVYDKEVKAFVGDGTEKALLNAVFKGEKDFSYLKENAEIIKRTPFSSQIKYMSTTVKAGGETTTFVKGAPEKIIGFCSLSKKEKDRIFSEIEKNQKKARRVICFAHKVGGEDVDTTTDFVFDGFAVLFDEIREEVYSAISLCKNAKIKVMILTGDNINTATAVAKELKIIDDVDKSINASEIDNLSDDELKVRLKNIRVIARSTPLTKLRVVKALKSMGEVVAVTGDGINDAPALKHADVGLSMGKSGSEIAKEASDIVLTDDSFNSIVSAISFGRNVFRNIQRFIVFQLSVNLSALLFIVVSALLGLDSPFNTLMLLWINVIMDGPPALTLGLERERANLMNMPPIKRENSIVSKKMLLKILFNGLYIGIVLILQYKKNFLNVSVDEMSASVFTVFVAFQLFNAFNCRELGAESIFMHLKDNLIMVITFIGTFVFHILFVQVFGKVFGISEMSFVSLIKCLCLSSSIIFVSEIYKLAYRKIKGTALKNKER